MERVEVSTVFSDHTLTGPASSELVREMADLFGFEPNEWRISYGVKIKGKSQALHEFDLAMESLKDNNVIPILYLRKSDPHKAEKMMLHRVKTTDIDAATGYVLTDFDLEGNDRALCDICNFRVFKLGSRHPNGNAASFNGERIGRFEDEAYGTENWPANRESRTSSKRRNRDRTKITQEILENVLYMQGASITQLIYKCNLNYKSAKTILNDLIMKELVKVVDYDALGKRYELTTRGKSALDRLRVYESV